MRVLPRISGREAVSAFRKLGYEFDRHHTAASNAPPTAARTLGGSTLRARAHTRPAPSARWRSPFFPRHLAHHLDLEVALRHELLQPRILRLELAQPLHIRGLERVTAYLVEPLARNADPVHVLRLIGIVNLIVGAIGLVWVLL